MTTHSGFIVRIWFRYIGFFSFGSDCHVNIESIAVRSFSDSIARIPSSTQRCITICIIIKTLLFHILSIIHHRSPLFEIKMTLLYSIMSPKYDTHNED